MVTDYDGEIRDGKVICPACLDEKGDSDVLAGRLALDTLDPSGKEFKEPPEDLYREVPDPSGEQGEEGQRLLKSIARALMYPEQLTERQFVPDPPSDYTVPESRESGQMRAIGIALAFAQPDTPATDSSKEVQGDGE
jgi:hypothetical protein